MTESLHAQLMQCSAHLAADLKSPLQSKQCAYVKWQSQTKHTTTSSGKTCSEAQTAKLRKV